MTESTSPAEPEEVTAGWLFADMGAQACPTPTSRTS